MYRDLDKYSYKEIKTSRKERYHLTFGFVYNLVAPWIFSRNLSSWVSGHNGAYSSLSSLPAFSYFSSAYFIICEWNTLESLRSGLFHSRSNSGGNADGIPAQKQYVCLWKHVRHLVSFPRGKGYFATRVNYYSNSDCSFHLIRLIVSGDISVNPGPENCVVCLKPIARNHQELSCDQCDSWCQFMSTVMWKEAGINFCFADKDNASL